MEDDVVFWLIGMDNVKKGFEGVLEDVLFVLLLFCVVYFYLLVVLDDEEFYDY